MSPANISGKPKRHGFYIRTVVEPEEGPCVEPYVHPNTVEARKLEYDRV